MHFLFSSKKYMLQIDYFSLSKSTLYFPFILYEIIFYGQVLMVASKCFVCWNMSFRALQISFLNVQHAMGAFWIVWDTMDTSSFLSLYTMLDIWAPYWTFWSPFVGYPNRAPPRSLCFSLYCLLSIGCPSPRTWILSFEYLEP